jgi:hypothetical protein
MVNADDALNKPNAINSKGNVVDIKVKAVNFIDSAAANTLLLMRLSMISNLSLTLLMSKGEPK